MKLTCILSFLLLSLVACTDTEIEPIDNYIFLHDNSSKVWLVDQQLDGDKDYTPLQISAKEIIVFHQSREAYFHRLKDLGTKPGIKMSFWMDQKKNELGFRGQKRDLVFEITALSRTRIVLKPKYKSYKYTIVLIPFPEY